MIVELVTFKAPPGADWDDILADARAAIPRWRANRELVRKHFLLCDDGRNAPGSTSGRRAKRPKRRTTQRGARASRNAPAQRRRSAISQLQMLLDNEAGTVTEWSQSGTKSVRAASMILRAGSESAGRPGIADEIDRAPGCWFR